jgi:hypothetical protein
MRSSSEVNEMRFGVVGFGLLFAVAGCGNKNTGQDMAASMDMASSDVDMSAKTDCTVALQDCGTGMKCAPTFTMTSVTGKCVTDGTVAPGGSCTPMMSSNQILDNCMAGSICDTVGNGSDMKFTCDKICTKDTDCGSGTRCLAGAGTNTFGWCVPTCNPTFGTGTDTCPAGSDCSGNYDDVSATMSAENGFFVCKHTGAGGAYAACMIDSDCGAGLWCDNFNGGSMTCTPICSSTVMCVQPPADAGINMVNCHAFADQMGKGYCYPM